MEPVGAVRFHPQRLEKGQQSRRVQSRQGGPHEIALFAKTRQIFRRVQGVCEVAPPPARGDKLVAGPGKSFKHNHLRP